MDMPQRLFASLPGVWLQATIAQVFQVNREPDPHGLRALGGTILGLQW